MKKILISILVLLSVSTSSLFANVEFNLNYNMLPINNIKIKDDFGTYDLKSNSWWGVNGNVDVFIGEGFANVEFGIGAGFTFDSFSEFTTDYYSEEEKTTSYKVKGFNLTAKIGPIMRWNFAKNMSLSITPSLGYGFTAALPKGVSNVIATYTASELLFCADVSYKFWFIQSSKEPFLMGLNVGMENTVVITGKQKDLTAIIGRRIFDPNKITTGYNYRVSVGLCFNFGPRNIDKYNISLDK